MIKVKDEMVRDPECIQYSKEQGRVADVTVCVFPWVRGQTTRLPDSAQSGEQW